MKTKKINCKTLARKITGALSVASLIAAFVGSSLTSANSLLSDILFFGGLGLGICLAIAYAKLIPNADQYRCEACGHVHTPACSTILRMKLHLRCPACEQRTTHSFVVPNKADQKASKKTPAEKTVRTCEVLTMLMPLGIFLISDSSVLGGTWRGDAIAILAFLTFVAFYACRKLTRYSGSFVCSVCGQVHTPTVSDILLSESNDNGLLLDCSQCKKETQHTQVSRHFENPQEI